MWVYAGTAFFARLWRDEALLPRMCWTSVIAVLGVGSEVGQMLAVVPGTFDPVDAWLCVIGAVVAYFVATRVA